MPLIIEDELLTGHDYAASGPNTFGRMNFDLPLCFHACFFCSLVRHNHGLLPFHRELVHSVYERLVAERDFRKRDCQLERWNTPKERRPDDFQFEPRQWLSDTGVYTMPKSQMMIGFTAYVDAVTIRKLCFVAIG